MSFSLLIPNRINLRTKRYNRKCHKPEPVGIFYTVWYLNLFDSVASRAKKEMATTVTISRLCVYGDVENGSDTVN